MALNPITVGDAIAAFVKSSRPTPGVPVTDLQLQQLWEGIMTIIYNDLKANMGVLAGTFEVTGVQPGSGTVPVIGVGGPAQ